MPQSMMYMGDTGHITTDMLAYQARRIEKTVDQSNQAGVNNERCLN